MVLWKATMMLVAGGLTGSGIVAFTRSGEAPERVALTEVAFTEAAAPSAGFSNSSFDHEYVHARFAAQRPFATISRVSR